MTWTVGLLPEVAASLSRAMETSFGGPVTAYLTDAYFIAGSCIGVVHRHVRADIWGRFQDGHRVRTSDVLEAHQHGEFWVLHTFTGSLYVVVTFMEEEGRQSLGVLLERRRKGMHTTPRGLQ